MSAKLDLQSYTIPKTAAILDCSVPTVYRLINKGDIKTFDVGADKRITGAEIARYQGEAK